VYGFEKEDEMVTCFTGPDGKLKEFASDEQADALELMEQIDRTNGDGIVAQYFVIMFALKPC
jgi:hypothetical protein